ncbi:MAG TPA: hypothetical protein VD998_00020 [Verrucomicrobiae bacterium]|nr:hypothetical protein [Verrucomicrobiae bacterium]
MHSHTQSNPFGSTLLAFLGGMIAWALIGPKVKDRLNRSTAWHELKAEVDQEVSKAKDMTQSKYEQVVDEVSSRYAKVKSISNHELRDLVNDLKTHWYKIRAAWDRSDDEDAGPTATTPY